MDKAGEDNGLLIASTEWISLIGTFHRERSDHEDLGERSNNQHETDPPVDFRFMDFHCSS